MSEVKTNLSDLCEHCNSLVEVIIDVEPRG